jgi:membrane-associated protease RseP (regulator of RpoE activity)
MRSFPLVAAVAATAVGAARDLPAQAQVIIKRGVDTAVAGMPTQGRIIIKKRGADSTGRDSTVDVTVSVSPDGIVRMIGELLASRELEDRIVMEMRGERRDPQRLRELETRLQSIARRNTGLVSAIRLQCASEQDDLLEGYMGINFEGITINRRGDGPTMYAFSDGGRVVSVEPGSPAERAGLEAGDAIVSIAGMETRRPIPLGALLRPGAKLPMRIARDGRSREVTLTIAKRPDTFGSPCASMDDVMGPRSAPQVTFFRRGEAAQPRIAPPAAPEAPAGGFGYAFVTPYPTGGGNLIGGASFVVLDQDWRETLGVDRGLLVVSVAPGSPAQAAGLRKSDVVTAAGDTPVARTGDLWRAVNAAGRDGVALKVQRGRKEIVVTIRAGGRR